MNNFIVGIYKNHYEKVNNVELDIILSAIKDGRFSKEIADLRDLVNQNKKEEADRLKKQLLAFTPCGTFDGRRTSGNLQTYNQLIVLDYDDIPGELYSQIFQNIISEQTTYCAFKSPSGNGIKVLVVVDSPISDHREAFLQVKRHYEGISGHQIDGSGKDISRLCYVSYDGDLYLNENSQIFNIDLPVAEVAVAVAKQKYTMKPTISKQDLDRGFSVVRDFTNNKEQYFEGNRNNYVHQLACNANRAGIPFEVTLSNTLTEFGYDAKEVTSTVESAYKNTSEFGIDRDRSLNTNETYLGNCKVAEVAELQNDYGFVSLENLPFIPDEVYDQLPFILKESCSYLTDLRQRDIFLTGALGVLSGCMPNISGRYHNTLLYPNLYVFITAPAASGKGALTHTRNFGVKYHKELTSYSDANKAKSLLFIPGNSSSAALTSHLQENDGRGIFFESEADTLANTFKQEWGNFSDLLRKGFHHEAVSYTRKGNNEYIEIERPKLSVVLSGTPKQVQELIKSSENGLFSRFLFYAFKSDNTWEDVKPSHNNNIYDFIDGLSERSYKIIKKLEVFESLIFTLKDNQWDALNKICALTLKEVINEFGDAAGSLVKRMGVIWFRIALILTALRSYDTIDESKGLFCSDIDFETAKRLILTYKDHILYVYSTLPKDNISDEKAAKLYSALPEGEISTKEIVAIAATVDIGKRNASNVRDELIRQHALKRLRHGVFSKI